MPLAPYQYRPITPPVAEVPGLSRGRRPSNASQWSLESFPDSLDARARTPLDGSPVAPAGHKLLPKLRTQDHSLHPARYVAPPTQHRRAVSTGCEALMPAPAYAPSAPHARSTTSPPERLPTPDPDSAISACFSAWGDEFSLESPATYYPGLGGPPSHRPMAHGRAASTSSIDPSQLLKYCNPAYRALPAYVPHAYWADSGTEGAADFVPPPAPALPLSATSTAVPDAWDLPQELQFTQPDEATSTLDAYLRAPNPAIDLCQTTAPPPGRGMHTHFWWDIRNLRAWDSFSLAHVLKVPGFRSLLHVPVASGAFPDAAPQLRRAHRCPESEAVLADAARIYYATKVNAALKVAMPAHHTLAMRACRDRDGPQFVSNYQNDTDQTLAGNGRGRVVGLVRSHRVWNSSMRSGNGVEKVAYLEALALLHRHMREHQTRYGFILTETELVCARAGTEDTPFFGLLELAAPVETRVHATLGLATPPLSQSSSVTASEPADDGALTVPLALWYLHMLAKEDPLPGQPGWRLHIGPPAAMSRQRTLPEKDAWIPQPQKRECRDSKTVRGWVWPSDPWNKKREGGKTGNRR